MKKILVADDAKVMRANISRILENLNYQVVAEASNGFEAVEHYKTFKPDLVTMDITMPGVNGVGDGIEAVQQIKQFDKNAKIVMITSHSEQDKVIRAIKHGASNYVLKPIDKDKLKVILEKLLKD